MAKKKNPPTVESIMAECEKEIRRGLGKKRVGKDARTFWDTKYRASITTQLSTPGSNWLRDRKRVLPVSRKLGKIAAVLAHGNVIPLWAAEAASVAVKSDPKCPGVGAGGYCDI
jgi:hypothetical protein